MNLLPALSPLQWALVAAVPPAIIALYFLKLKRQPVEVPSTYLWTRTVEDLHVNSIWQRLRQSLLLFLQLLLVLLAILALLRPGWRASELVDERIIFLIDNSASMRATDIEPSRLEEAKRRVLELIEQMNSNQVAMVITFSDIPDPIQSFTNSRSLLRQKVNRIQPSNRRTDPTEALRAAAGLANPGRTSESNTSDIQVAEALPATLYIFTDGGFPPIEDFSLGNLTPNYKIMGVDDPENVGIVNFSTERNSERPDQSQAFARLENTGPADIEATATLYLNDVLLDAAQVNVPAGESAPVSFELESIEEGVLTLELEPADQLAIDNRAHSVLNVPRRANVLVVTPGNEFMRLALTTDEADRAAEVSFVNPDVLETDEHQNQVLAGAYDLVIYDRCIPVAMPQANTLFIGNIPPLETWSAGQREQTPIIVDTDPAHPLTNFVEMGDVKWILEGFSVDGPEGATTLFDADLGPLMVIGDRQGFEDVVLGMEIQGSDAAGNSIPTTDWPARRSFPVFLMNTVRYLGGARSSMLTTGVQPGMPISLRSTLPVEQLVIDTPEGGRHEIDREGQNKFVFSRTEQIGIYEVREGSARDATQRFAVNLFNGRESDLRPERDIQLGYETVEGIATLEPARQELWKWLLMAGLLVLVFEWYVYNRRVYL